MSEEGPFRKFKVLFAETLSGRSRADKRLLAFQTALRLAFRVRWEVLEEYGQLTTERELRQTRHLLRSIETEGMQDGVMEPDLLLEAYEGEGAKEVMNLYTEWGELRFGETNSIEVAFKNEDPALLRKCLAKLRELNHRYMIVAARRAPHVIDTYWGRLK